MADAADASLWWRLARRWSGPLMWATVSQALSSLSNFGLYILLLVATDRVTFGQAVAVLAVYQLMLTLSRSLITEPHVATALRVADVTTQNSSPGHQLGFEVAAVGLWRSARRRLAVFAVAGAVLVIVVAVAIGFWEPWLLILAAVFPILLRQDGQRHLAWGLARPELSVGTDLVWLVVAGAGLGGYVWLDPSVSFGALTSITALPVSAIVVIWLAGGCAGAAFGWFKIERRIGHRGPTKSRADSRSEGLSDARLDSRSRSGGRMASRVDSRSGGGVGAQPPSGQNERLRQLGRSEGLQNAAYNLLPVAVATVVSPSAAGLLKAGLLPFSPMLALFAGLRLVSLPLLHQTATVEADAGGPTPSAFDELSEASGPSIDRVTVRILALVVPAAALAVVATIGGLTIATFWLGDLGLEVSSLVWWGGAITVMSIATKQLADALGVGRRSVAVVRRRLIALAAEWTFLFVVALVLAEELIMVGWAVGVAIGTLFWLAPGLRAGQHPPSPGPAPLPVQ